MGTAGRALAWPTATPDAGLPLTLWRKSPVNATHALMWENGQVIYLGSCGTAFPELWLDRWLHPLCQDLQSTRDHWRARSQLTCPAYVSPEGFSPVLAGVLQQTVPVWMRLLPRSEQKRQSRADRKESGA